MIDRPPGRVGGRLVLAMRAEPKTFNPVPAMDIPTRTIVRRLMSDLVHVNRQTWKEEPALAKSWKVLDGGRRFELELRRGLFFSDGHPFDADDVIFTFQVFLDPEVASGYLPVLSVGGRPVRLRKLDSHRLELEMEEPYAVGVKLFDSIPILPEHRLLKAYREGELNAVWNLGTNPEKIVGLGPFRLKRYLPGEKLELERNPFYWKVDSEGRRLPYLNELVFLFLPAEETQILRFQRGEIDVLERLTAGSFHQLSKARGERYLLRDLGPGFAFDFLFFNLNDIDARLLPRIARKQTWFKDPLFRRAVSRAIDRRGMIRTIYQGRATASPSHVTPNNPLWYNSDLKARHRSPAQARRWLEQAGFSWDQEGLLHDSSGDRVEFTIVTNASAKPRLMMATIIQEDLRQLGIDVHIAPLEFSSLVDRVTGSHDYEAGILGLTGGMDPAEVATIWRSDGAGRLWRLKRSTEEPVWQNEIDRLMREQMSTVDPLKRKKHYDRVQEILAENEPCVLLVSPNVLVGANPDLGNFHPTILEHITLWNADELYWLNDRSGGES